MSDKAKSESAGYEGEGFHVQIDRAHYVIQESVLNGDQLRHIPQPPIGMNRDFFEVIPGKSDDRKIELSDMVTIRNGQRFFTAPAHINPGTRIQS